MYAKYFSLTNSEVRPAWLLLLLDTKILKISSNRLLFLAVHTRKFQSYLCCPSKNLEEIRKNGRQRKKFQREYRKYCEPKKYEEYLKKERETKQTGMYLGFQIAVVRARDISVTISASTEMKKLLAILINIELSCLIGEVLWRCGITFSLFVRFLFLNFFRVSYSCSACFELFRIISTCFRFLLCLKIELGPPGTVVHTKTVC